MRGRNDEQQVLFHVFNVEERIRADHPLREVKRRVDAILQAMSPAFVQAYSRTGRPSVPPERLLKAMLVMTMYSIRSERQLCERLQTDLLFRWFLDMQPSEEAFDHAVFAHNRVRLDEHDLTKKFFDAVVSEALTANLCSEHFSVDGTMIESFASAKSFQPKAKPDTAAANNDESAGGSGTVQRVTLKVSSHAMSRSIFTGRSARMKRTRAGRIPKRSCIAKALAKKPNCRTWVMP